MKLGVNIDRLDVPEHGEHIGGYFIDIETRQVRVSTFIVQTIVLNSINLSNVWMKEDLPRKEKSEAPIEMRR